MEFGGAPFDELCDLLARGGVEVEILATFLCGDLAG
jgi:hypothetical protein